MSAFADQDVVSVEGDSVIEDEVETPENGSHSGEIAGEGPTEGIDSGMSDLTVSESGEPPMQIPHPFYQSNDTSDLRLVVEGKPLYVSRVVLSLVSPVLKNLFASRDAEDTVELQMMGKKYDDIVEFLCCIYPDILNPVTADNVEILLPLAEEYQVQKLFEKCENFLVKDIQKNSPATHPDKIVHFLNISDKFGLDKLQKATFETAAKTESDLLENVVDFWDLPSVTTTSVFIRRLKLLEQCGKNIRNKISETRNHCSLYHKGDRGGENICTKCFASIGKTAMSELKQV